MSLLAHEQPPPDDWFADGESDDDLEVRAARVIAFARRPHAFRRLDVINVASNDALTDAEIKFLDALAELIIMNDPAGTLPAKEAR